MTQKSAKDEGIHKQGSENIYKNNPGPTGPAKSVKSPLASFKLFSTDAMIRNIVQHTDNCIQSVLERFSDLLKKFDKYPQVKVVDQIDIGSFIGILHLRWVFRQNLQSRQAIWNHESSHDVFASTMSENRFKFICRFLTFDDKSTRADRWKGDRYPCIRELFEAMNLRNAKMRYPSALVGIDETLYLHLGCISFKNTTLINLLSMVCCTMEVVQNMVINKRRRFLAIKEILGRPQPDNFIANTEKCFKCVESIVGTKLNLNYKIKQKKLTNKLKTKCSKLLKFIYKKHKNEVQFV